MITNKLGDQLLPKFKLGPIILFLPLIPILWTWLGFDGSGCVGYKGFRNGPTEESKSLKDIDDAAGVEGCHCSDDKLIERPNLVEHEK